MQRAALVAQLLLRRRVVLLVVVDALLRVALGEADPLDLEESAWFAHTIVLARRAGT